jgi:UDP-glucose 6-dehydrogenase
MKVGIIGVGMVGGAMAKYYRDALLYDPDKGYNDDVSKARVIFVCVPTNTDPRTGLFDLSNLHEALSRLENKTVVIRSTVVPGTCRALAKKYPKLDIYFNPEFLSEATAYENFIEPMLQRS